MDDTARASMVPEAAARDIGGALVVDLDGSLIRTDTTLENLLALAKRPVLLSRALLAWRHGRARLKQELAAAVEFDPAALPYNDELLAYLREQHAAGRVLVLATGADRKTAEAVARHLGLFDLVLASDGQVNLTGRRKQLLLVLDNCEHLIDACAELVDQLLRACPELAGPGDQPRAAVHSGRGDLAGAAARAAERRPRACSSIAPPRPITTWP